MIRAALALLVSLTASSSCDVLVAPARALRDVGDVRPAPLGHRPGTGLPGLPIITRRAHLEPPMRRLFDIAFKIAITGLLVLVVVTLVTDAIG